MGRRGAGGWPEAGARSWGRVYAPLCGAGASGLACGVLDFAWASPAFPRTGDPDEALAESSGEERLVRYLVLALCAAHVTSAGVAISAVAREHRLQKSLSQAHVLIAFLLACAVGLSNRLAGARFNRSRAWQGPNWIVTQAVFTSSLGLSLVASRHVQKSPRRRGRAPRGPLRASSKLALWAGSLLSLAGVGLLVLGSAFYMREPVMDNFGALGDHVSYLEWQCGGGSFDLGDALRVQWGPDEGLLVTRRAPPRPVRHKVGGGGADDNEDDAADALFATVGPTRGFLVAALRDVRGATTLHADNPGDAGTFTIIDVPGRLSTEQIVEDVHYFPEVPAIEFVGSLYFVPGARTGPGNDDLPIGEMSIGEMSRTSFRFVLNASGADIEDVQYPATSALVRFAAEVDGKVADRLYLSVASYPHERIFGMGETFTWMDLKGASLPVLAREQGVGRGLEPLSFGLGLLGLFRLGGDPQGSATQTTYTAIPHITTSFMRSLFVENYEFSVVDLALDDRITVEANSTALRGGLIAATSPLELVDVYTGRVSGRMRPLPSWTAQGAIVGMQGGRAAVMRKLARLLAAEVPVAALWLQDWAGRRRTASGSRLYWNWEVDATLYPDWDAWTRALWDEHGIRVLTYTNPHLSEGAPMFEAARKRDCLLRRSGEPLVQWSSTPDFRFGTVDLFQEDCMGWYVDTLKRQLLGTNASRLTVSGWMADFGEGLPFDVAGSAAHNQFPVRWAEANRRVVSAHGQLAEKDAVFFTRSAGVQTPMFSSLQWMGDQLPTWDSRDGLHSAVIAQISSGLSGLSQTHSDIGGYTMLKTGLLSFTRTTELFQRWMEHSALADDIFRSHEGLLPDQAVQPWDDDAIAHFKRFACLHQALGPMRLAFHAQWPGRPWVQSTWTHFPNDQRVTSLKTQYFVGSPAILVCPALEPGARSVPCFLPGDGSTTYVHVFSAGLEYHGNQTIDCPATLGFPCVLSVGDGLTDRLRKMVSDLPPVDRIVGSEMA